MEQQNFSHQDSRCFRAEWQDYDTSFYENGTAYEGIKNHTLGTAFRQNEGNIFGYHDFNQIQTNNYYRNPNSTLYDINTTNVSKRTHVNERANWPPSVVKGTSHFGTVNQPYLYNRAWTNGAYVCVDETGKHDQWSSFKYTPTGNQQSVNLQTEKDHGHPNSTAGHTNVLASGQTWTAVAMANQSTRLLPQADDTPKQTNHISPNPSTSSRKRKLSDEISDTTSKSEINNDDVTSPKIDKRALYSKFRVVKKSSVSPKCNESSKVKPLVLRVRLDDKTIVEVNDKDGLPSDVKMAKHFPTVTPSKENEAGAAIRNIKFITLDNMKVVRRKLQVVLAVQQANDRQERLKLEAEVKAKVKATTKSRSRKEKKFKDQIRGRGQGQC